MCFFSSLNQRYYLIIWVYWFDFLRWAMWPMDLLFIFGFFESACEAKRLLAIMCIRFLANPRLCKNPQRQLVRVYQRFIYKFSNTFPLHLILSSMVWYFKNNSKALVIKDILQLSKQMRHSTRMNIFVYYWESTWSCVNGHFLECSSLILNYELKKRS